MSFNFATILSALLSGGKVHCPTEFSSHDSIPELCSLHFLQVVNSLVVDGDMKMGIVKQQVYENANAACQIAIHPFEKK